MPDTKPFEFTSPAGIRYISAPLPGPDGLHPCQICALGRVRMDCCSGSMYPGEPTCCPDNDGGRRQFIWVEAPLVPEPGPNPL